MILQAKRMLLLTTCLRRIRIQTLYLTTNRLKRHQRQKRQVKVGLLKLAYCLKSFGSVLKRGKVARITLSAHSWDYFYLADFTKQLSGMAVGKWDVWARKNWMRNFYYVHKLVVQFRKVCAVYIDDRDIELWVCILISLWSEKILLFNLKYKIS